MRVNTVGLTDVQTELLEALREAAGPLTATQLRTRVNAGRVQPLIAEQVYRRLVALERRGLIGRAPTTSGRRDTSWQATAVASGREYRA